MGGGQGGREVAVAAESPKGRTGDAGDAQTAGSDMVMDAVICS